MPDQLRVTVNGTEIVVPPGTTVAAAIVLAGQACRTSVGGELRGPLCGMGICYECRAVINGSPHRPSCQVPCAHGMEIRTDE